MVAPLFDLRHHPHTPIPQTTVFNAITMSVLVLKNVFFKLSLMTKRIASEFLNSNKTLREFNRQ